MSDSWLSSINALLQWIAVIGTGLGLLSGIGLVFTRREMSERQAIRVSAANADATVTCWHSSVH
jgi:hypothetical protein